MENRIYILYALNAVGGDGPALKCGAKGALQRSPSLYFYSLLKAESAISCYREAYAPLYEDAQEAGEEAVSLYCLVLETWLTDSLYPEKLSTRVFSPDGAELDGVIYQVGDIIESPFGEHLQLGIVAESPFGEHVQPGSATESPVSEACYTVLAYPSMDVEYLQAPFLFAPKHTVDHRVRQQLNEELDAYLAFGRR